MQGTRVQFKLTGIRVSCRDTALCIVLSLQLLIISDGGVKEHVKTDDLPRACVVVLIVNILFIL